MRGHRIGLLTQFAVVVAASTTVLCCAVSATLPPTFWSVAMPAAAVLYLSVPLVGAAVVRADQRNPVGWILLVSGIALPVAGVGYVLAEAAYRAGEPVGWAGWWDGWPWVFALGLTPTVGLLLFPDGRPLTPRWRPVVWVAVVQAVTLLLGLLFQHGTLDYPDQANPIALPGGWGEAAGGLVGTIVLTAPLSTLGAWSVHRRRLRAADPRQAAALRLVTPAAWLISASWWSCIAATAVGGSGVDALPLEMIGMLTLAVTAWIAIRRHGLFDGRRVLSRALVYGLLTVSVAVVYLAVAAAVDRLVADEIGTVLAITAALFVALPLRDVLQRTVNRVVYGYRDDPYAALVRLGRRLEVAAAPDVVLPGVTDTVRTALRLPYVAIRVGGTIMASSGSAVRDGSEEFPLVFAGETIGELVVATDDEALTATQRRLITDLLSQIAAAGHAVALAGHLRRSRERLIGAAEEERRRLRRDLHDGLGPALAGVVLGLQRARRRLPSDTTAAAEQLDVLTDQTQAAVAEVRRLVYGLRPPALDELGLVGALVEQARSLGAIEVEGPDGEPDLPAAVEVAAYRIAMEAMTNTVRHAQAAHAVVRVTVGDALRLEIADDGRGLPEGYRAGVGISSMRERATELGGTCHIQPYEPHGTIVRVTLPLGER